MKFQCQVESKCPLWSKADIKPAHGRYLFFLQKRMDPGAVRLSVPRYAQPAAICGRRRSVTKCREILPSVGIDYEFEARHDQQRFARAGRVERPRRSPSQLLGGLPGSPVPNPQFPLLAQCEIIGRSSTKDQLIQDYLAEPLLRRSITASISAPPKMTMHEIQIQVMKPTTAPSDPYVLL